MSLFLANHYLYVLLFCCYICLLKDHMYACWLWRQENRCKELSGSRTMQLCATSHVGSGLQNWVRCKSNQCFYTLMDPSGMSLSRLLRQCLSLNLALTDSADKKDSYIPVCLHNLGISLAYLLDWQILSRRCSCEIINPAKNYCFSRS